MSDTTEDLLRQVLERLDRLEQRLDAVQERTQAVAALSEKAPQIIELAASSAEFAWSQAEEAGIDPIASGQIAAGLALEAGKVENLQTIGRALAKTALLGKTLDAVEALEADGTLDILITQGPALAPSLAKMLQNERVRGILESAAAETATVETVEAATTALVETKQQGFTPLGLFGQLRMLGDSDVQKAIGFTLAIAKRFGQRL